MISRERKERREVVKSVRKSAASEPAAVTAALMTMARARLHGMPRTWRFRLEE